MEEIEKSLFYPAGYQRVDICGRNNRIMFGYVFDECRQCVPDEKNQECGHLLKATIYVRREDIKREPTSIDNRL